MVLRIEAGDSCTPPRLSVREPTGSPVSRLGLDDAAEDVARPVVEHAEARAGLGQAVLVRRVKQDIGTALG